MTATEQRPSERLYGRSFYVDQADISRRSARAVIPLVMAAVRPRSVVDVGCGVGTWLAEFRDAGVEEILGVDGSGGDSGLLQIPNESFRTHDLATPLGLDRRFDLAVSLEVAEHLPESAADGFVDQLVGLSSVVLFSAAIPGQGGTGHINERWQSWWAERFAARGYLVHDVIRPAIWSDPKVALHYAQNMIVYADPDQAGECPSLGTGRSPEAASARFPLDVVHPRLLERKLQHPLLRVMADRMPSNLRNNLSARLRSHGLMGAP